MLTIAVFADINAGINPPPRVSVINIGLISTLKSFDNSKLEDVEEAIEDINSESTS